MCEVDHNERDAPKVWSETWVQKARKPHECDTCGVEIPAGVRYLKTSYVTRDKTARTEKQCEACEEIARRFSTEHKVKPFPSSLLLFLDECADYGDDENSVRWRAACDEIRARSHGVAP